MILNLKFMPPADNFKTVAERVAAGESVRVYDWDGTLVGRLIPADAEDRAAPAPKKRKPYEEEDA